MNMKRIEDLKPSTKIKYLREWIRKNYGTEAWENFKNNTTHSGKMKVIKTMHIGDIMCFAFSWGAPDTVGTRRYWALMSGKWYTYVCNRWNCW